MATLIFTAVGTALGGPLGGAIGSLIGGQIDKAVFGSGKGEGPRLKELSVTTSSYGMAVARQYGTMRAAGTIIWSTHLVETSERSGGKGKPSVTTYTYSVSFAVALSSRPIRGLRRIWADGNLLRGSSGDLKTGGKLRIYKGHGDQKVDPLMSAAQHGKCPAHRGVAYCVFEDLQLADFSNRIPALTFEIIADDGEVTLANLVQPLGTAITAAAPLTGLTGYSDEGGSLASNLESIGQVYPLSCSAAGEALSISAAAELPDDLPVLPQAAVDTGDEGFGGSAGQTRSRATDGQGIPDGLRYYDVDRDFQAGMQRADGRARAGRSRVLEFPGALNAVTARKLANSAAERAGWSRDTLSWRVTELDPALGPGTVVRVPGKAGAWRIETWEWREKGVEMELRRLPATAARESAADAGQSLPAQDLQNGPTSVVAFELPWDGESTDVRRIGLAVSSKAKGWKGAALYLEQGGELLPAGPSGSARSTLGFSLTTLSPSASMRFEPEATFDVELVSGDLQLPGTTLRGLANGANRALLGGELLQFASATLLGDGRWRLTGLLRGRGGTERAARSGCEPGAAFVLLDDTIRTIEPGNFGASEIDGITAIGLADPVPVSCELSNAGLGQRPLGPVHTTIEMLADGSMSLGWTRRARGAWRWQNQVETPLNEHAEAYIVGVGDTSQPALAWQADRPALQLSPEGVAQLKAEHAGQALWIRQLGNSGASEATLFTYIDRL